MREQMLTCKLDADQKGEFLSAINSHLNEMMRDLRTSVVDWHGIEAQQALNMVQAAYFAGNVEGRLLCDKITDDDYEWLTEMSMELKEEGSVQDTLFKEQRVQLRATRVISDKLLERGWMTEKMYYKMGLTEYIHNLVRKFASDWGVDAKDVVVNVEPEEAISFQSRLIIEMPGTLTMGYVSAFHEQFVMEVLHRIDPEYNWDPNMIEWSAIGVKAEPYYRDYIEDSWVEEEKKMDF